MRVARPRRPRLRGAALAALVFCACRAAPTSPYQAEFMQPHEPAAGKPSALVVKVTEKGVPVAGAATNFLIDMAHPGMVPLGSAGAETASGRYEGTVTWNMAGDWSVLFEARWPDGRRFERRFPVRVAAR